MSRSPAYTWPLALLSAWMASKGLGAEPLAGGSRPGATSPDLAAASVRPWSDTTGKYKVEAALAGVEGGKARLKRADGKIVAIAIEKLSAPDQQYVRQWAELRETLPWLDANIPFDVVAMLEPIPDSENAAVLYPDALFEFSAEVGHLFPPAERQRREPIARRRWDQFVRLDEARRKDPKSVDPRAVDAWLAEHETGFKKLALAQQRPRCAFPTEYRIESLLGHVQPTRQVARVVQWQTRRDLQRGNFERPIQRVEMVLRLSRDQRRRGEHLAQLVSVAIEAICYQHVILEILLAPGVRPEHCDRLLAALARHDAEAADPFAVGYRTEYLIARTFLFDFQHRDDPAVKQRITRLGLAGPADSPLTWIRLLTALGAGGGPLAKEKYGAGIEGGREAGAVARLKELEGQINAMTAEDYAKQAQTLGRVYAAIFALEGQSMRQRDRACADQAIVEPLRETKVAVWLEPEFIVIQAYLRSQAALHCTECLIALRRWQLSHRELPPDLDALIKAAGMTAVPVDPYSDQPMRMTLIQGTPVIYSVGPDGKDDKALKVWNLRPGEPGDYVFRLEPPRG